MSRNHHWIFGAVAAQLWVETGSDVIWRNVSSLWVLPSDRVFPVGHVAMVPVHVVTICLFIAVPGIVEGMEATVQLW